MLLTELLEELEELNEVFRSKQQEKTFRACAHGGNGPPCKNASKRKWKKMDKEFRSKTSKRKMKSLPYKVEKKK